MKSVRELVADGIVLFDGGMGTYYSALCDEDSAGCDFVSLSKPEIIADIHRQYVAVGAQAIKTNTFGSNLDACQGDEALLRRVITAGWSIAAGAAGGAKVFADVGPVSGRDDEETLREYCLIADAFLRCGAENFLFETNADDTALAQTAAYIKERRPEAYIITSFAARPDGYTREGMSAAELLTRAASSGYIDAVGLNCVCSARHMLDVVRALPALPVPLAVMPNAGYPTVGRRRAIYDGDPAYFASQCAQMAECGARILGGCCGTTPEHIARMKDALQNRGAYSAPAARAVYPPSKPPESGNLFREKLESGKKVMAVELDPPRNADSAAFMDGARRLGAAGIDILTIADCPIGRARMDSSLLACRVKREIGLDAIPHMTSRDRNLNATKALLLGLFDEGVRNVLAVTGDPIPTAERDEVKSVYQFNSRKMARFIRNLGQDELPSPFTVFGALNVNVRNFDVQLRLAQQKLENGMEGFFTQPVLTPEAFENLKRAREELGCWLLGGIMPVVSEKNARFMDSEINGINVAPELTELYVGKDRDEGEELALNISAEIAKRISPYVDGFYLMTPFNRVALMERIVAALRRE